MSLAEKTTTVFSLNLAIFALLLLVSPLFEFLIAKYIMKKSLSYKDAPSTAVIYLVGVVIATLASIFIYPYIFNLENYSVFNIRDSAFYWPLTFLAADFIFFAFHFASHKIRWFWNDHRVHHSSTEINFFAGLRSGWIFATIGRWIVACPFMLLGFKWIHINLMISVVTTYQIFLHTELVKKLGPLEWLVHTPSLHRIHHATQKEYRDKNLGGVTLIFDYLFGTFQKEIPGHSFQYGLDGEVVSQNIFKILFSGWTDMFKSIYQERSLRKKLSYLFSMK